jgi:hypothetical protein
MPPDVRSQLDDVSRRAGWLGEEGVRHVLNGLGRALCKEAE